MVLDLPFCLFCDSEVLYDGRASSTLARGNYLVLYKRDRSVSIHGGTDIMPRNYMGAGSRLAVDGNQLIFSRKGEKVVVKVHQVHFLNYLEDWSESKIVICRTEKELARKIFDNWGDYFDGDFEVIEMEYGTSLGPIDIAGFTNERDVLVEVKRKRGSLKDVTQLRRYVEAMEARGRPCSAYLAAPEISSNALKYLEKHNLHFLEVDFDGRQEGETGAEAGG